MGAIQEYKCPACRKTWRLFTGHGMNHSTLRRVLEAFPADTQAEILKDNEVSNGLEPLFVFNYRPAVCRHCQDITAVPVLRFLKDGHSYIGKCSECGNIPELLEENAYVFCPKCLKQNISFQETGHWD